ncbi:hypothetical protein [Arthrobacter sp. Rue61a]|uniref:hypothetical protein n=1 Tax=Arthrobacter sp. Rue61a TaxID=1118963 RepID=UPI00027DF44F|nr:hypothetical protein [Arthrobacter sp. Rue61a]AFR30215.1 hypothetical protein ARUE_c33340 [Arthrobacter sp. Rue61a]
MEPHSPYPPNYFPHQPGQVQVPPLPAWARTFRTILLILAGVLVVLLLLLIAVGTGSIDMYTEDGLGALQAVIWLCLGMLLLAIPYVIASVIYAALWATKLRGRGYRRYPATTWILVAGPILAALPALALIGLITADPSML